MSGQILTLSNLQARSLAGATWRFNGQTWVFKPLDPRQPGQPSWKAGAEGKAYPLLDPANHIAAYIKFFNSDSTKRFQRTQWLIGQRVHNWLPHLAAAPSLWIDSRQHGRPDGIDFDLTGYVAGAAPGDTWLELKHRISKGQTSLPEALRWRMAKELIQALAVLEQAGLLHGDLSPSNVLVSAQTAASQPMVHLIDFDAFIAQSAAWLTLSLGEGGTFGTEGYCPLDLTRNAESGDLTVAPYSDRSARDMLLLEFLFAGAGTLPDEPPSKWNAQSLRRRYQSFLSRCPEGHSAAIRHLDPSTVFGRKEQDRPSSEALANELELPVAPFHVTTAATPPRTKPAVPAHGTSMPSAVPGLVPVGAGTSSHITRRIGAAIGVLIGVIVLVSVLASLSKLQSPQTKTLTASTEHALVDRGPLRPGLRRYSNTPFAVRTWFFDRLGGVDCSLMSVIVRQRETVLNCRIVGGARPRYLLYEPPKAGKPHFNNRIGMVSEELYLIDGTGAKLYSLSGFEGGSQSWFNTYARRINIAPGEVVDLTVRFPAVSESTSRVTFVSPSLNGWQAQWRWNDIPLRGMEVVAEEALINPPWLSRP